MFPPRQKSKRITGGLVNKAVGEGRKKAGLLLDLVLYCARHDFGTYVLQKTGNIAAVMNSMGHTDVKVAMTYQRPEPVIESPGVSPAPDFHDTSAWRIA